MLNNNLIFGGSENNEINIKGIADYKMLSADKVLGDDLEFHLESDDSGNDVYYDDGNEFEAES